jgi:hypothetical protein
MGEKMTTLRLKDQNAMLKRKFGALREDINDNLDDLQKMKENQQALYDEIDTLDKDIQVGAICDKVRADTQITSLRCDCTYLHIMYVVSVTVQSFARTHRSTLHVFFVTFSLFQQYRGTRKRSRSETAPFATKCLAYSTCARYVVQRAFFSSLFCCC